MINFVEESTVSDVNTEATTAEKDSMSPVEATSAATETTDAVGENSTVAERPEAEETQSPPETEEFGASTENIFFDEYPENDCLDTPSEEHGDPDGNVFFDEFPSEANPASEEPQETDIPKSYKEMSKSRACGGSYKELKNEGWGWGDNPPREVHHMPADSASHLEREDGPAIAIDYTDHQQTASCGSSRDAKEYRAVQKELIDNGDFRGALQMDIDDLRDKFGDKYDNAISQMLNYVEKLEQAGKI